MTGLFGLQQDAFIFSSAILRGKVECIAKGASDFHGLVVLRIAKGAKACR